MKILVLGAGGVGGYFGARLAQSGTDVAFLVRPRRADNLMTHGMRVESPHGTFSLQPRLVQAGDSLTGFDIVLLTCKAYDLESAMDAIEPAVVAGAAVLPLLNGIAHLDRLDTRFGRDKVLGGTCHIAATLSPEGVIRQLHDVHRIMYGERDLSITSRIQALDAALQASGVEATLSADIELEMWEKVAFLCTLAGMTCIMRGSIGEVASTRDGVSLLQRYLTDCFAVAAAHGHAPRDQFKERMLKVLNDRTSSLTASMLRDLRGGSAVEADHIVGFMLDKAREAGIDDTLLAMAYTHLKVYESQRSG